jgi:hypothetical protein
LKVIFQKFKVTQNIHLTIKRFSFQQYSSSYYFVYGPLVHCFKVQHPSIISSISPIPRHILYISWKSPSFEMRINHITEII